MSPVIITDKREQKPLFFQHLASEPGTLHSGDYSIRGLENDFAVERKSIADLCQSVTRGRERCALGRTSGSCPIPSAVVDGHTAAMV